MHFGMPTLLELKSPEACAVLCGALGLDFIELSMDMPEYQPNRLDTERLRRVAEQYGIDFTIHLSGFLNPATSMTKSRRPGSSPYWIQLKSRNSCIYLF